MSARKIQLSIVIPVFNEAGALKELVERTLKAGEKTGLSFEIIIVDDGSTDDTHKIIAETSVEQLKFIQIEKNAGQFIAIKKGLLASHGKTVVTLDGDLQDPPEKIPEIVGALHSGGEELQVVFAVKASRQEPLWAKAGQAVFHILQSTLARVDFPSGAGTFCAMRRETAFRVALSKFTRANLPSVLSAMKLPYSVVKYDRSERYDSRSRIGFYGLFREAIASMAVTGSLHRLLIIFFAFFPLVLIPFLRGKRSDIILGVMEFPVLVVLLVIFIKRMRGTNRR